MDIPVYLVAGFLDSGKTSFINGILEDGFAREDKTLLICCEEGDEEYEKKALDNVTVVTVDDEDELTLAFCKELEKKHHPKQVLIEYNGMWQMEKLYREVLPANWVLYQIMTFVQAPTFELFVKNMGQLMMEKITNADMLVFNRCTPELKEALRARNLRMVNRRADIYLEVEGKRVAVVQSYTTRATRTSREIEAFGENEPVATIAGANKYTLELSRLYATDEAISDGINFYDLNDFSLVICKPDKRIIYSQCRWSSIEEAGKLGDLVIWDAPDLDYICYRFGSNLAKKVIKRGRVM